MSMHGSDARGWPGDDLEVPPHSLDLDAIVQVGRRQVRHRRMAMVGGTAAVLAAVAAIPATVPLRLSGGGGDAGESPAASSPLPVLDCDVTELPLPAEYAEPGSDTFPSVMLTAMDPTGRYAIGNAYLRWSGDAGNDSDPDGVVLWEDGRATVPAPLRGNTGARGVNADGVVVGGGEEESTSGYAWVYRDGQLSRLPTPDGYHSAEATAINAPGDVVGTVTDDDGRQNMVVWPADGLDNPRVLAAPPGQDVVASGITDDGRVVGGYYDWNQSGDSNEGVVLWEPDGTLVELPMPDGAYSVLGTAVRGNWAVGYVLLEPEGPVGGGAGGSLLWDLSTRTLQAVADSDGVPNQVQDVNAAGDLLFLVPPAVIRGGVAYALPDPVEAGAVTPPDTAHSLMVDVRSVSDDGSTIAGGIYFNDTSQPLTVVHHPVLWRC